jgi:type IV secretion system protein VirD4
MFGRDKRPSSIVPQPGHDSEKPSSSALHQMPRGIPDDKKRNKTIPSAEFASDELVLEELLYRNSGYRSQIVLGEIDGVLIGTKLHREDRHLLTVAGSRSGKSVSAIIPNLLEYQGSVLVTDPKAELANETALRRANDLSQKVYVLDPFGKSSQAIRDRNLLASFNPLSILQPGSATIVEDADLIADAIIVPSGGDAHWDESAKLFLQGLILHVATFSRYENGRHLGTVRDLINQGTEIDVAGLDAEKQELLKLLVPEGDDVPGGVTGLLHEMFLADENVVQAAAYDLFSKPEKERGSVLSTLRRQTAFLDLPSMRSVLVNNSFPGLGVLKSAARGVSIYLCLPAGYMRTCNRWLRLFVYLALQAMERTEAPRTGPGNERRAPVLFCLDEFPVLGYMPQLEEAAGQLAGFGVRLWPIIQDLTQLKALYKGRWETFIGNAGVLQFFGVSDLTTLEYISKLCGKVVVPVESERHVSANQRIDGAVGDSWAMQSFDLLPVHEARVFLDRDDPFARQLLLYQGLPPIIASRIRWYEHPFFRDKGAGGRAGGKSEQ